MDKINKYQYRKPELKQYRQIWLTEESYKFLRKQKKIQKLSMSKILDNILKQNYGNVSMQ